MQSLANGMINGLIIALMALGFTVVYLPTKIFHVSLGGIYVVAPFVAWACLLHHVPLGLVLAAALGVGMGLSGLTEIVNHRWLSVKRSSSMVNFISSLGIYIVLVQATAMIWGNNPKILRSGIDPVYHLGSVVITRTQATQMVIALLVLGTFQVWLRCTTHGLQFRALASNPDEISLRGYNVNRLRLFSFCLSGLLGALSGLLVAFDTGFSPQGGLDALVLAIVAMTIGGRHTLNGPVLGGILLGTIRAQSIWLGTAEWQQAITFAVLAAFLLIRPEGILASENRIESLS